MIGLFARRRLPDAEVHRDAAFRSAAASDVGRIRRTNEDRVLDRPDRGLWAVADGMGGLSRGDVAAEIAIAALAALADDPRPIDAHRVSDRLADADRQVRAAIGDNAGGTTIVVLLADANGASILWAGDSRAYRLTDTGVERLTRDHSLVADLVEAGLVAPAQADHHPQANVVTRALGAGDDAAPQVVRIDFVSGDRILLASDGLYRSMVPGDAPRTLTPEAAAAALVTNAGVRDGSDNASCVVIDRLRPPPVA